MAKVLSDEELLEYIQNNFIYDDGKIKRLDRKNSDGSYDKDGYLIIKIKGKQYKAHRIVFALVHGRFPDGEIDHINGVRDDNRIENLRECTRLGNVLNEHREANKDTKYVGIYYDKTYGLKKHYAFHFRGKTYRFATPEEAYVCKDRLRRETYGDYYTYLNRECKGAL